MNPDHCTLWPDRIGSLDWATCCLAHDIAYELALPRLQADLTLARCVWEVSPPMAMVMAAGVIACGWAFYKAGAPRRGRRPTGAVKGV